jgi:two-component system CheB/CheR fusion protein
MKKENRTGQVKMDPPEEHQENNVPRDFRKPRYIVAIGGSAGSLKPMIKFFDHTPVDDISYVVLRHIVRNMQSLLEEILQLHSPLKVIEVTHDMEVEKNTVYILPAGFYMTIKNGHFHLHQRIGPVNCAIDIFMESLAKEYKEKSIGIILSGLGTNGTKGVISIKQAGGNTIVQKPSSCEFDHMPESAIKTGCVDDVARPEEMPAMIEQHVRERSKTVA